jgi:hypothetical protein
MLGLANPSGDRPDMDGYASPTSSVRAEPVPEPPPARPVGVVPANALIGSVVIGGSAGGAPLRPPDVDDDNVGATRL